MSRLCLDTSAYTHLQRGAADVTGILGAARSVLVPVIVIGELRFGFRLGSRAGRNEEVLRSFLSEPVVEVGDVDAESAAIYADLMADLRRKGTPLASNDVWIAAVALREGATVLTYDAGFDRIPRVGLQLLVG